MDGVGTPIIGRPRPLPGHDTPNPAYHPHTLNYEEPLNPQVWSLFVVATMCGMVAYVVSVVRTSDLVLGSLSGLGCVGGGLLILAALTVKRPAKSQPLSPA